MATVLDTSKTLCTKPSSRPVPPPLVRKKSGEIVKPAIKPKLVRYNSTPTKFVHFDSQLEYVKLFMKSERPESISNPPSDEECSGSDDFSESSSDSEEEMQLSIRLPNFPPSFFSLHSRPVVVEKVYLTDDKSRLMGNVMVHNLAFHKSITLRYTFDFWQSVQEIELEYQDVVVQSSDSFPGVDKFRFNLDLNGKVSLKVGAPKKNMFFAIRYQVNGHEIWDNNEGVNYQVEFVVSKPPSSRRANSWPASDSSDKLLSLSHSKPAPLKSAFSGKLGSRYSFGMTLGPFTSEPLDVHYDDAPKPSFSSSYFFSTKNSAGPKGLRVPNHSGRHGYSTSSWDDPAADRNYARYSSNRTPDYTSSSIYGSYDHYSGSSISRYSSPYGASHTATCIRG